VIAILNDPELDSAARRGRIEKIAYRLFDFETMSKLVLARNWRSFSPEQRRDFVEEFKQHLSRQYGSRIDRYEQEQVEVTGTRDEARGDVTVHTKVVGGQFDGTPVDYRLRHRSEDWRIIDVVIEGVSLVSSFRDQFGELARREGPDGLLRVLREKNAKGEVEGEVASPS
jgi:phospholipid transport system substrate-binding protein